MKFTIITATLNSEKTIQDCIKSVENQTYQKIEHIVIDGESQDKTLDIIKKNTSVKKCISESDEGIYDALNKGIQLSTGSVIGILHSDDFFASPDIIQDIAELFFLNNIHGVYGDLVFVDRQDTNKVVRTWQSKLFERKNVHTGWMPPHPTLFLKKEVYQKLGLFDKNFKIAGDYDFMLRIMHDKEINLAYLPEVITKMRMGGASTRNIKQLVIKSKEDIRALRNNRYKFTIWIIFLKIVRKISQLFRK